MSIERYRGGFLIFVVDGDFAAGDVAAHALRATGYDAKTFPTVDSALAAARVAPPHIAVFNLASMEPFADSFLEGLSELSEEIRAVLLIGAKQTLSAIQYVGKNLAYDYCVSPMVSQMELIQKVDRAAAHLLYRFESEQLRELLEERDRSAGAGGAAAETAAALSARQALEALGKLDVDSPSAAESSARTDSGGVFGALSELNEFQSRLSETKDLEPAVEAFLEALSRRLANAPALYFRYLPQHLRLAVAQSAWLPIDKIRGVGADLKDEDPARLAELLAEPEKIEALRKLLAEAFRLEKFSAFAHRLDGEVVGVVVIFGDVRANSVAAEAIRSMRLSFESVYRRNQLLKEKHVLDIFDPGTGLLNRRGFLAEIEKEITRARRILSPVSLLALSVEGLPPSPLGAESSKAARSAAESAVKTIAAVLKKTARVNDFIGRVGPTELMFLLPHTSAMGAAIKAERTRRAVETLRFPPLEGCAPNIRVSIGASEYPSHSSDVEGLIKTADEALWQVKRSGGNKVCLAIASEGFQKDFEFAESPDEIPSEPLGAERARSGDRSR